MDGVGRTVNNYRYIKFGLLNHGWIAKFVNFPFAKQSRYVVFDLYIPDIFQISDTSKGIHIKEFNEINFLGYI